MEIKINIDESKFKDVLEKELDAFTQEELHEILKSALKEYLNREDVLKEFLNRNETDRWGGTVRGTSTMDKLVNNVDLNDVFAEPKEKIKEIISQDEILKSTAIELLANLFRDRFKSAFTSDYSFMEELACRVANELSNRNH